MARHFALVARGIPNPATSGGALTNWTVINELRRRGHRVTACLLLDAADPHFAGKQERYLAALADAGAAVVTVPVDLRALRGGRPGFVEKLRLDSLYPWVRLAPRLREVLDDVKPDGIFVYEVVANAAMHGLRTPPRLVALVDLDHLPALYRFRYGGLRPTPRALVKGAKTVGEALLRRRAMPRLLADATVVVNFADHHAAWLRTHGAPQTRYMPTPIGDPIGSDWTKRREALAGTGRPRILMIGHLHGTATRIGLDLFARATLPLLERELGPEGFEVHIVGGFADSLPPDLLRRLERPSVRWRGHVEPADDEFLAADVLLVPTPIKLGTRVRIIVGWAFGSSVVAHDANGLGIPEMVHGKNALLASDGEGMGRAIVRLLRDPALRAELALNGRRAFEEHFAPAAAGARLVTALESMVKGDHA